MEWLLAIIVEEAVTLFILLMLASRLWWVMGRTWLTAGEKRAVERAHEAYVQRMGLK